VIDAAAVLAEELVAHCAKLTILATSREPLRCRGEHNWRVPGLGLASPDDETDAIVRAPAVGLFVARAVEADPTFELNDENARDIALATRRLDGIPLAIELAAARLSVLSPAQIATRLESSLDVLGTGARTALTRQQTLRATIAWSYNLLSEEEREVFRRLSVFAGSFPVEAAEIVSSGGAIEQRAVLDVLARLVSKSLVMVEDAAEARYRLLDTIRQYGAELLDSTGERREAEASHRRWVVGLTEEPVAAGGADSVRLELDHDNIRTALATGLADEPEAALRITAAVWRLWLDLSYYTEGARQVEAVLAANPSPSALRARVLLAAAALGVRLGDPDGSVASAREAEAVARAVGDPLLLADVLHAVHIQLAPAVFLLGSVEDMRPAFAESEAPLAEAIELAEACGAHHIVASALHASSLMYLHRGDVDGARRAVDLSLERLSRVPADAPPFFEGVTAGFPVLPEGPGGRPRPLFEQTIFLFHRFGRAQAIAHALANLAVISRMQGRQVEARELLEDALARFRSAGDSAGEALALMGLGNWARTFGQPDAAYAYLDESLSLQRRGSDRRAASLTECDLALALASGGDHERARSLFVPLRERFRLADDEPALAGLLLNWGAAEEWAGELDRAAELLEEGTRSWWERTGGTSAGWAWLALADVLRAAGSGERADEVLRRARTILERVGDARGVAACDVHPNLPYTPPTGS
jgi:predicted ATPase